MVVGGLWALTTPLPCSLVTAATLAQPLAHSGAPPTPGGRMCPVTPLGHIPRPAHAPRHLGRGGGAGTAAHPTALGAQTMARGRCTQHRWPQKAPTRGPPPPRGHPMPTPRPWGLGGLGSKGKDSKTQRWVRGESHGEGDPAPRGTKPLEGVLPSPHPPTHLVATPSPLGATPPTWWWAREGGKEGASNEAWDVVGMAWGTRGMLCWACCATWHVMGSRLGPHPSPPPFSLLLPNLHHLGRPHQAKQAHTNQLSWVMGVCSVQWSGWQPLVPHGRVGIE